MIFAQLRPEKIYLLLLFAACLMFVNCREESTGCVSLIFDEHTVPPRGMLEDLKEKIKKIDYVHTAEILGLPEAVIDIVLDRKKMEVFGLFEEEVSQQIQKQVADLNNIKSLENIRIETKEGYLIPLPAFANFVQRMERHDVFDKGRQVYVIKIEYTKEMHGQLINELENSRELSWKDFIIDFNCDVYSE